MIYDSDDRDGWGETAVSDRREDPVDHKEAREVDALILKLPQVHFRPIKALLITRYKRGLSESELEVAKLYYPAALRALQDVIEASR
jgi:hypothetical protein